jgi:glucose-6-phosphate-specific signal transduction histidine kinase
MKLLAFTLWVLLWPLVWILFDYIETKKQILENTLKTNTDDEQGRYIMWFIGIWVGMAYFIYTHS